MDARCVAINCDSASQVSAAKFVPKLSMCSTQLILKYFVSLKIGGVYISGILALISCICYAIFALLSIIQIAMITSRDKVVLKYKPLVIIKLTLAAVAGN